ncbi:MAG: DUF3891 family protein [Candidatus Acidiferrum sp.]
MIVQQHGDPIVVIRQTDHAFLSGFFAREWGNEVFERPEPFASFCLAAAEHDNGWQEWEMLPGVDPKTFAPHTFMTVPTDEHIALYQRGIERAVRADLYTGMLIVGHCMNLYDRARATMPGYSAKYVRSHEQHLAADFVQRLRLQQLRLKVDLRNDPAMRPFTDESRIKANQQRLDALDRLSLYFCLGQGGDITIEDVPVNEQSEVDWQLREVGENRYTLDPYPFRREPLEFALLERRIPKRRYMDEGDLQKVLTAAPFYNARFTLRSGAAKNESYAVGA